MKFHLRNFRIDTFDDRVEVTKGRKTATIFIGRHNVEPHTFGDSFSDMNAVDRHTYTIWVEGATESSPLQYGFGVWCDDRGFNGEDNWKVEMAVNLLENINYMDEFNSFEDDSDYTDFGDNFGYTDLGKTMAIIREIKDISNAFGFKVKRYSDVAFISGEGISEEIYNMLVENNLEFDDE